MKLNVRSLLTSVGEMGDTKFRLSSGHTVSKTAIKNRARKQRTNLNSAWLLGALALVVAVIAASLWGGRTALASNPASATLSPTSTQVTWVGTAPGGTVPNAPLLLGGETLCQEGINCETFTLTLSGTPADWAAAEKAVHIHIGWLLPATDYDLYIHKGDLSGDVVANSGRGITNPTGSLTSEDADLDPSNPDIGTGTFAVHVVYYTATAADQYTGTASLFDQTAPPPPTPPTPVSSVPAPKFVNYADPNGAQWGEPSLGINPRTNNVMYISSLTTYRISFDDTQTPARATWADKSFIGTSLLTWDPILFTDNQTGRTFVSQLQFPTKQSTTAFTDNDGDSWLQSQGASIGAGVDHQTIGGGPFHAPLTRDPNGAVYPNAVYYAAQDLVTAEIGVSLDGGMTFGPAVPMYTSECVGIHGHIKVAPDGTVYVPNRNCGGQQSLLVSKDNGISWQIKKAPGSHPSSTDPSLGIGADGTVYFGYADGNRTPRLAVYKPQTDQWISDYPVGGSTSFTAVAFPAVVAGDSDRAAFAFLGTTTPGIPMGSGTSFSGVWHLYIATTYDGGASYTLSDATPNDPVQRGNVCDEGTGCPSSPRDTRNLLDFMDAQVDKEGRVVVAYADGCVSAACIQGQDVSGRGGVPDGRLNSFDNDGTAIASLARQSEGKRLFAAYDGGNPTPTPTPTPSVTPTPSPTPTPTPTPITPVYQKGGITFSPNVALRASVAGRDGEPSLRVDKTGNAYVAGIRGVPAGVDLWYIDLKPGSPTYDPLMRNPIYRGQPDQFSPDEAVEVGADGGGDVDLAVGFDESSPGQPPYLAFSSLTAANISAARSTDRGATFTKNPAGNVTGGIPADDRQWMEAYGKNSVYLLYRIASPLTAGVIAFVQRSDDGGLTYNPAREVGAVGQVGGIDVDQNDGTVYVAGSNGVVAVGTPVAPGLEPLTYTIRTVGGGAHIFFTVKVANDGTVYVCYSDGKAIFIKYSRNKGVTWSQAVRVSDGPETATSLLPWIETGPVPGSIGVVWYGSTAASNNDNADWKVFFAQSLNATSASPVFRQVELSDHFIHGSNISESGLSVVPSDGPNRNLLDYFQIGFDPMGAAVVAYTDDHNDFDGNVYVARQIGGPGVKGTNIPQPVEGSALPPVVSRSESDPQVIDYAQDAKTGLLTVLPVNDPLDILSVKYSTEGTADNPVLVATMKVSDLSVVPPVSNWRMNFTANAPDSRLSPRGDYSFGLSDRGDQFFLRATTDATGARMFTYGTTVRQHSHRGILAYTDRGTADSGSFDSAAGTITIKVSLDKLNAFLPSGHARFAPGAILVGLRGSTFTTGDDNALDRNDRAKSDVTRGGTLYEIESPLGAILGAGSTSGSAPFSVNFDGSASRNPNPGQTIAAYVFDFGDGAVITQSQPRISHTYSVPGTYNAALRIVSSRGTVSSSSAPVRIVVNVRPPGLP